MTSISPFLIVDNVSIRLGSDHIPSHPYSFSLDPFQEYAFSAISKGENVLVCAKTGSGKTLVGEYQIYDSLRRNKRVFYTSPIKSLSNQKFNDLKKQFPEATVGIMTGDIKFCPDAQIVIMTTEILRNLLYKKDTTTEHLGLTASLTLEDVDAVIFDECHYMNDPDRGKVWEETMMKLPADVRLILLSATLNRPERIASWLGDLKKRPIHLIETQYRVVPLTHYVIGKNNKLMMFMDEKEQYQERVYSDWLRGRAQEEKEHRQFQQRVQEVKSIGTKGGVDHKIYHTKYIHRLNQTVQHLEEKELLPALLFVFSRKQCESYAEHIEKSLLDTSDTATVKHILSFHLHRYREQLEKTPQYHQLIELLYRGIAFHHSGLLPILKEAVELLFARGYVKLLVCTETFAVGLNMPTKTVLFAGLRKFDDRVGGLRVIRNDEYFQMAGRAGRRGKDDRGVVIYLPEGEPLSSQEMYSIMKGDKPEVTSRMDFHVDFILKTIHSNGATVEWDTVIRETYWYQARMREEKEWEEKRMALQRQIDAVEKVEPYWSESMKCRDLEQRIKQSVNAQKRDLQRQLESLKNRQLGPQWKKVGEAIQRYDGLEKAMERLLEEKVFIGSWTDHVDQSIGFLRENGFIQSDSLHLTLKGTLATEVNEGHPILLTEFYVSSLWKGMTDEEWVMFLSAFLEQREEEGEEINKMSGSLAMKERLYWLDDTARAYEESEQKWCGERSVNWTCSTQWMEPMRDWLRGSSSSEICQIYGFFEGNFYRSLLKLINVINEVMSMAIYCEHVDVVDQMVHISEQMRRSHWTGESLYLQL